MPRRDSHDHALLLLSKARADKLVLDKLADDSEIADDVIGFHAQQAVEKLLKAILANRNVEYPRAHDMERLDRQGTQQLVDAVLEWADAELAG